MKSSRSTSCDKFIFAVIVEKTRRFWRRSGKGNSIFRSRRPGLRLVFANLKAKLGYFLCKNWPEKRWIKCILTISSHDNLHIDRLVESVHLSKNFKQNTLDFAISTSLSVETLCSNRINFINENDTLATSKSAKLKIIQINKTFEVFPRRIFLG